MKKLLIVVDYQIDFVDGALGFEGAEKLDERIADKINSYRSQGWDIAYTFDTHEENYLSTQEGKNLPVEHCIKGGEGHKLYGLTADTIKDTDKVFYKPTFGSGELYEYLKDTDYEQIELVGLVSNICVISNAVIAKTALPEAVITVDASCTDSFDKELNEKVLDVMAGLQMNVVNR